MAQNGIPGLGLLSNPTKEDTPVANLEDGIVQANESIEIAEKPAETQPEVIATESSEQSEQLKVEVQPPQPESQAQPIPVADVNEANAITVTSEIEIKEEAPVEIVRRPSVITIVEADTEMSGQITIPEVVSVEEKATENKDQTMVDDGPSITSALEALLGMTGPEPAAASEVATLPPADDTNTEVEPSVLQLPAEAAMIDVEMDESGAPEFEVDSSPYVSSDSDDSSDDSSSEEDSDDEGYELLGPEEQARILMEEGGGSDDEGGANKGKGTGAQLRTKNEIPEEVIPKPDVTVTPEMKIFQLGTVEGVVEAIALIKANTTGEYRVLESGSVLCLEDRSVIGAIAETIGRVQQPLYTVRFTNAAELAEAGLEVGKTIYYVEEHSTYVFTQALKAYKGSDASNLHDEEVGDEEMEFSDDEKEMEHKRRLKQKKIERRGGKQNGGPSRGGHPLQQQHMPYDAAKGLSYDEEEDGPYKPLARPAGFADTVGRTEAPQEGMSTQGGSDRGGRGGQGRGRGRGDRGRGRGGDRGRGGRGGYQDRSNSYSQPPQSAPAQSYPQPPFNYQQPPSQFPQPQYQQQPFQQQYQQPFTNPQSHNFQAPQAQQFPQYPPQGWVPPPPPFPSGGYLNPAFFGQQQQQQGGQQQWTPPVPPPPHQGGQGGSPAPAYDLQAQLALLRSLQAQQAQQGQGNQGNQGAPQ